MLGTLYTQNLPEVYPYGIPLQAGARRLREEQDAEYLRGLEADRQKEEQRQQEERRKAEAREAAEQAAAQERQASLHLESASSSHISQLKLCQILGWLASCTLISKSRLRSLLAHPCLIWCP